MKRPELKTPELKVPNFLSDLYYDLRDRRLLPVIALVVAAIAATPFLLGQDAEPEVPPPVGGEIQALKEGGGARTSSLTVVEAKPGLRDYRKRLHGRTPLDPFRPPPKPSLKGAQLGNGSDGGEKSSGSSPTFTSTTKKSSSKTVKKTTKTTTTTTTTNGKGKGDDGSTGGGTQGSPYLIDVEISIASDAGVTVKPVTRGNVKPLTPLPGEETPVVTYLGVGSGASKALFSVSKEVTAVYGEAKCVSGTDTCEVLELEPDFPVTFVYGPQQARYRITLLKIARAGGGHS